MPINIANLSESTRHRQTVPIQHHFLFTACNKIIEYFTTLIYINIGEHCEINESCIEALRSWSSLLIRTLCYLSLTIDGETYLGILSLIFHQWEFPISYISLSFPLPLSSSFCFFLVLPVLFPCFLYALFLYSCCRHKPISLVMAFSSCTLTLW